MDDESILRRIEYLSEEELKLEESHQGRPATAAEAARLHTIQVELDQAYDLLRQRRARRLAGQDPDWANERQETVVEGYLQ